MAKNAVVLGCSMDGVELNKTFAEQFDFPFPLLCDTDGAVATAYSAIKPDGSKANRVTVVIQPAGKISFYDPKFSSSDGPRQLLAML